ncbi:MAG TPA: energy transducer TonB, partial [Polyangiaceae bacterium]|nr:energy transducer TonB [Polyangiaceae bacterium]
MEAPKLRQFAEATYPPEAERAGLEGSVVLSLRLDAAGRVEAAEVATGAGHGFDEAAVEAARRFEFEPAKRGGRPVPAKILYRYEFRRPAEPAAPPPAAAPPARGLLRGRVTLGASSEPLGGALVALRPKAAGAAPGAGATKPAGDGTGATPGAGATNNVVNGAAGAAGATGATG